MTFLLNVLVLVVMVHHKFHSHYKFHYNNQKHLFKKENHVQYRDFIEGKLE